MQLQWGALSTWIGFCVFVVVAAAAAVVVVVSIFTVDVLFVCCSVVCLQAVKCKHLDVVEKMVALGAKAHTRNDYSPYAGASNSEGQSPIEYAVNARHLELLELLLQADDVIPAANAKDHLGNTPLHRAAQLGFKEAVAMLLAVSE